MKILIRSANSNDVSFIYSTWLRSHRYDSELGKSCQNSVYYEHYKLVIDRILKDERTITFVACLESEPDTILGYLVGEPGTIHYCYVKEDFRRFGLGRQLVYRLQSPCQPIPPPPGPTLANNARPVPAIGLDLAYKASGPSQEMVYRYICTHKTFLSRPIFAKYSDSLTYNPFSLYKLDSKESK
jgi:hypothetical protein